MDSPASCASPGSSPNSHNKRKRSDSNPNRRAKAPRSGDVKVEGQTSMTIPIKGPYDDLGFDPFAPHPGMTKEERKLARMIRNRNAAQASRDRKKEHVTELEIRVQELEAQLAMATQLNGAGSSVYSDSEHGCPASDFFPALLPPSQGPSHDLSERSPSPAPSNASTISPTQAASLSQARIAALEEENGSLRDRLEAEARRSGELKGRLEGVEKRFESLEKLLGGLVSIASSVPGSNQPTFTPSADVDWASVLAPTPTVGTFPANVMSTVPAPTCATPTTASSVQSTNTTISSSTPAVPSITMTTPEDPTLNSVTAQSNSNRLVAREVSLQRTLALPLTDLVSRAPSVPRLLPSMVSVAMMWKGSRNTRLTSRPSGCSVVGAVRVRSRQTPQGICSRRLRGASGRERVKRACGRMTLSLVVVKKEK